MLEDRHHFIVLSGVVDQVFERLTRIGHGWSRTLKQKNVLGSGSLEPVPDLLEHGQLAAQHAGLHV